MFCEECGMEIPEGASVCPTCGAAVARAVRTERPERPERPERRSSRPAQRDSAPRRSEQRDFEQRGSAPRGSASGGYGQARLDGEPIRSASTARPRPEQTRQMIGNQMLDGLVLADGETIVRQYLCVRYESLFSSATGKLTVTNKRLLFLAKGNDSRLSEEVSLDSVSGLMGYYGRFIELRKILIGIALIILGLVFGIMLIKASSAIGYGSGSGSGGGWFILIALVAVGALLIFTAMGKVFGLRIYAKDVNSSPIQIGSGPKGFLGNSAIYGYTGDERSSVTDQMLNELGALVKDLQSMGDHAIEKWQSSTGYTDIPNL